MALSVFSSPNPVAKLNEMARMLEKSRKPYDSDMLTNLAFYLGEQYVEFVDDISTIRVIKADPNVPNMPRPVANKIMHFACAEHASALQSQPTADVLPATDDMLDIELSGVGKAFLQWLTDPTVEDWEGKLAEAAMWSIICGPAYLKWTFSDEDKRPCISVPQPLDIYCDPYVTRFKDARYVMQRRFMDVEQVYDLYDIEVPPNSVDTADLIKAQLLRNMGHATNVQGVMVYEIWHTPSKRYPKGMFAVWTNQRELIPVMEHPYDHKRIPFTQLGMIPRPGSPYYNAPVKYLISGQMELNKYHAQRIMTREAFASPKWFLDSELAKSLNNFPDDTPMQVLVGDSQRGQLLPHILTPAAMQDNNEGQWIAQEMMDIVGLHEVSQGSVPGRVESAKAIDSLRETDITRLAELNRTVDYSMSEGFYQCIMLAKQYMKAETIVQTYSRDGLPETKRFMAEDFSDNMRIRITHRTGLADTRAARQEQLLLLWQNQIIQDPALMAELMELPIPTFIRATAFDMKLARSENFTLADTKQGNPIMPNSWDDHAVHIEEHNNFRKTSEYLSLPDTNKQYIEHHVQMHQQFQMQALQDQLQKQQMMMQSQTGQPMQTGGPQSAPKSASPFPPGKMTQGFSTTPQAANA